MANSTGNNQKRTHAKRRPEETSINREWIDSSSRAAARRTGSIGNEKANDYRYVGDPYKFTYESNKKMHYSLTPVRRVPENSKFALRAAERRVNRTIKENEKEKKWQEDIVRVRGSMDYFLLIIVIILVALGAATVYSATYPVAIKEGSAGYRYFLNHLIFLGIGLVLSFVVYHLTILLNKRKVRTIFTIAAYLLALALLVLVRLVGKTVGTTTRWIVLGPISIQPSEIMKIAMIFVCAWFAENDERFIKNRDLIMRMKLKYVLRPYSLMLLAIVFILIGHHLSGAAIVGIVSLACMIVAGYSIKYLLAITIPLAAGAVGVYFIRNPYSFSRITAFFTGSTEATVEAERYQTQQSIYGIGSGGILGKTFGQGQQKYGALPFAHTDFVFSTWCEEMGFIGAVILIILFLLLIWRGYLVAMRAPNRFTMVIAFGLTTHLGLQAVLNMCVATDLIMNTGITLPFFTYGGSALVINLMEVAALLGISRQSYKKKKTLEREQLLEEAGMNNY